MGGDYYPVPWEVLTYDTERGGYVVNIDRSALEKAPRYDEANEPAYDPTYGQAVHGFYGIEFLR